MTQLTVGFIGDDMTVDGTETVTFGRTGDIVVDTNPAMHRIVGQFYYDGGSWWLANRSTSMALDVADVESASSLRVAPGASVRLSFARATVGFTVGTASYALNVTVEGPVGSSPSPAEIDSANGDPTEAPSALPLTPEQKVLVAALAEPWLRSGAPAELPTNRAVAAKLGWSITKFNRKLDSVCVKLADGGVSGLVGTIDQLARDRRHRLVEHAVYASLVTPDDLDILAAYTDREDASISSSPDL